MSQPEHGSPFATSGSEVWCGDVSHPCWTGVEADMDHDWHYDGGDYSVGINPGWVCASCDEVDTDREAPSYDDDY